MWKFVTRGIRDSFERRACRSNIYSQSSQDPPEQKQNKVVKRCQYKRCIAKSFSSFYNGFYGRSKYCLGPKEKEEKKKYDAKYSWSDAVSWSGILALGYVVCQSLCLQRRLFEIDNRTFELWHRKLLVEPHTKVSRILSQFFLPEPRFILPVSKAASNDDFDDDDEILLDAATPIEQPYGPITAQEALKEAIDEFASAHESLMGELELDSGSKAIKEQRYKDAMQHFKAGAEFSSVPSLFNLGLCYELGLGTPVDYTKAVQYYKKAADKGHVDAMYNLGVFHAQGKGGLKVNIDAAKKLFTSAAKKGHNQALKALELEKEYKMPSKLSSDTKYHLEVESINNIKRNNVTVNLITYDHLMAERKDKNIQFGDSFEKDHLKTPTDIFLDMLGAKKQNVLPIFSVVDNGP